MAQRIKLIALLSLFALPVFGQLDTVNLTIRDFGVPSRTSVPDFMRSEMYKVNQSIRNIDSINNVVDVTDSSAVFTTVDIDSAVIAVLDYSPPHGSFAFSDSSYALPLTVNTWAKVTNAANDLFTAIDADGITFAGDTITIVTPGDYVIWWGLSFSGGPSDVYHAAVYKNGAITPFEMHRNTSNADIGNANLNGYLDNLAVGDDISLYMRNTGDNDDPTLISSQVSIFMIHPR